MDAMPVEIASKNPTSSPGFSHFISLCHIDFRIYYLLRNRSPSVKYRRCASLFNLIRSVLQYINLLYHVFLFRYFLTG